MFWSKSVESMSKDIQETAVSLGKFLEEIEKQRSKLEKDFASLKKLKPELGKLGVRVAKIEEYKPKLQDKLHGKKVKYEHLNHSVMRDTDKLLNLFDQAVQDVKNIVFDANTLFVNENKVLDGFAHKIKSIKGDSKLANELLGRINEVKEEMKSVARRLFESSRAEEHDIFDTKPKKPIAEQLKKLGVMIDEVGKVLVKLNIDNIDDIVKKSEQELTIIKKVGLEAIIALSQLERLLDFLKAKYSFLEESTFKKADERLSASERRFLKIKKQITEKAKKLFENIKIQDFVKIDSH